MLPQSIITPLGPPISPARLYPILIAFNKNFSRHDTRSMDEAGGMDLRSLGGWGTGFGSATLSLPFGLAEGIFWGLSYSIPNIASIRT